MKKQPDAAFSFQPLKGRNGKFQLIVTFTSLPDDPTDAVGWCNIHSIFWRAIIKDLISGFRIFRCKDSLYAFQSFANKIRIG
jgi:hypothetical protein